MALAKLKEEPAPKTLENALVLLCSYGEPRLTKMKSGWYAKIEMFVSSKGASFDIASEFDESTPMEAVNVLIARLQKTLSDLGV